MKRTFISVLCFILISTPSLVLAQNNGIRFEEQSSWEQIKLKAKEENKYIFLDAFTTWCTPCKAMEKFVYSNDTVGDYFNDKFVSVKLQMDKTPKDNEITKKWYNISDSLAAKFKISAYPTFIFLSPDGLIVSKETGYREVPEFLSLARKATAPGSVYKDPFESYDSLVLAFNNNKISINQLPFLVETAIKIGDTTTLKLVGSAYSKYLLNLEPDRLYTKENISFITKNYAISSESRMFQMFYKNEAKVDSAMQQPGYSKIIIDRIIQREEVEPVINISSGLAQIGLKTPREPNWKILYKSISKKYNKEFAARNLLQAKITWYRFYKDWPHWSSCFVRKAQRFGIDTTEWKSMAKLNDAGWVIFNEITDQKQINAAIKWMKTVMNLSYKYDSPYWTATVTDTYSNLLYKIGRQDEAIGYEKKVVDLVLKHKDFFQPYSKYFNQFTSTLDKMRIGQPTWKKGSTPF
jgi:thioredoxin-related protein